MAIKALISLLAVPRQLFCFLFFGDFRCGVLLFMVILAIYINMKIGKKKLLNARLTGDHLFTWLSLVISVMVSFGGVFPKRYL